MIDREKTIERLGFVRELLRIGGFSSEIKANHVRTIDDAIALLKEQEAVEPDTNSAGTCTCGNCGETVGYYPVGCKTPNRLCRFCPECGKAVKWDD